MLFGPIWLAFEHNSGLADICITLVKRDKVFNMSINIGRFIQKTNKQ